MCLIPTNFIFLLALFNFENKSFMPTKIYDFTEYQVMGIVFKYLKHYKGKVRLYCMSLKRMLLQSQGMNKDKNSERINEFYTNIKVLSLICLDKDNTENVKFFFSFFGNFFLWYQYKHIYNIRKKQEQQIAKDRVSTVTNKSQ